MLNVTNNPNKLRAVQLNVVMLIVVMLSVVAAIFVGQKLCFVFIAKKKIFWRSFLSEPRSFEKKCEILKVLAK
jgi:hypothetical protein